MKRIFLFSIVLLGFASCHKKMDKYVYVSGGLGVLHIDKDCKILDKEKYEKQDIDFLVFVDTSTIRSTDYRYCKECVTTEDYEHIKRIVERNLNKPIQLNMRNVKKLYYKIYNYYNDVEPIEDFAKKLETTGREGIRRRKYLYETFKEDGLIDELNFEDFDRKIVIYE